MDAVEFLRDFRRMCWSYGDTCTDCELKGAQCRPTEKDCDHEKVIRVVEEWSAAHPRKTRQSVFLAQWPEAEIDKFGSLAVCPKCISADCRNRYDDCGDRLCPDCRKEFWFTPIEEEEE